MKLFGKAWNEALITGSTEGTERLQIRRDWDAMRRDARTPQERDEIDAMFARYL